MTVLFEWTSLCIYASIDTVCGLNSILLLLFMQAVQSMQMLYGMLGWTYAKVFPTMQCTQFSKSQFFFTQYWIGLWCSIPSVSLNYWRRYPSFTCVCVCTTLQVCLISLSLLISNELLKSQLKMNTSASVTLIRYKRYVVFIKRKQQRPSN